MAYTKLGRIRPVYRGVWSASADYTALEMVKSADGRTAYIALKDVPAGTALAEGAYWGEVLDVSDVLDAADAAVNAAVQRADEAAARADEAAAQAPAPLTVAGSGNPQVFWPDAGSALRPVISMRCAQSGSPAPDNPCPIAGRTQVRLYRQGRNLLRRYYTTSSLTENGITFSWSDGVVTAGGTASAMATFPYNTQYQVLLPAGTYRLTGTPEGGGEGTYRVGIVFPDGTPSVYDNGAGKTFTIDEAKYIWPFVRVYAGASPQNVEFRPMLRPASAGDDSFEPYSGDVFTVDLGETVCGGTLDAASGALETDRRLVTLTGGEAWVYYSAAAHPYWYTSVDKLGVVANSAEDVSSHFKRVIINSTSGNTGFAVFDPSAGSYARLAIRPGVDGVNDLDTFKAWLAAQSEAGTPVQVCYMLKEPASAQLEPVTITAPGGLNTVFTDGDGLELTYNKALVREREELLERIAALEAAALNNA